MKKLTTLFLMIVLSFVIVACSEDEENDEPIELTTPYTDALTLDTAYEGKSFINDGIGQVTLATCIDGDTAHFFEGNTRFSVRFLAIDTPESTGRIEPWGRTASDFVCEKLENADVIVLEADNLDERMDSYGNRYLGFVWYDGRLINLEVIEEAFSHAVGAIGTKYGITMYDAWDETRLSKRRIHGEVDPDYDYEAMDEHVTIEELVTNTEAYMGRYVTVSGVVTSVEGGKHPWLQEGDYGIYLYTGQQFTTRFEIGNEVLIKKLQITYWPDQVTGALQLTNLFRHNIELLSENNEVTPHVLAVEDLTEDHIGSLVRFENLTLKQTVSGNEFTLRAEDAQGHEIQIRKNSSALSFDDGILTNGTIINITGPIHIHQGTMQIVITRMDDVEIVD